MLVPLQCSPPPPEMPPRPPLRFADHPEFRPNLTPEQCIRAGIFGGVYFNPIGGKPGTHTTPSGRRKRIDVDHREFPPGWFRGVPESMYLARRYDRRVNKYGVVSGKDQRFWEEKGWIDAQDPRGWFQWYCRFYCGRRTPDDERQIRRWQGVAGEKGRFRTALLNKVRRAGTTNDDHAVSPVTRQTLLHWAYQID